MQPIRVDLDLGEQYYAAHSELDSNYETRFEVQEIEVSGLREDAEISNITVFCLDTNKHVEDDETLDKLIEYIQDNHQDVVQELAEENAQVAADAMYDAWKDGDYR